jgi:hypothetical protein
MMPKVIRGYQYIAFTGYAGRRTIITSPIYKANNIKLVNLAIGRLGVVKSIAKGTVLTLALTIPLSTAESMLKAPGANIGIVILLSTLILGGIAGSHWVKSHVENAGYIYCWRASGSGAVSKTLVYTKDMEICEKLVEDDRRRTRTMPKKQAYYPSQLQ